MSSKLIAQWESRSPVEPKLKQEIFRQIYKYIIENRRPRPLENIAARIRLPESETLEYMDIVLKQSISVGPKQESAHIRFVSRDGFDGYLLEKDKPAA
jgi:hypothetical protein